MFKLLILFSGLCFIGGFMCGTLIADYKNEKQKKERQ